MRLQFWVGCCEAESPVLPRPRNALKRQYLLIPKQTTIIMHRLVQVNRIRMLVAEQRERRLVVLARLGRNRTPAANLVNITPRSVDSPLASAYISSQ
jgi:hypothetical protein